MKNFALALALMLAFAGVSEATFNQFRQRVIVQPVYQQPVVVQQVVDHCVPVQQFVQPYAVQRFVQPVVQVQQFQSFGFRQRFVSPVGFGGLSIRAPFFGLNLFR